MILIPFFRIHLILRIYVCSSNKINFLSLLFCWRRRTKNLFRYAFSHATSLISKLNVCLRYVQCFISIQIHCIRNCVRVDSEFNVVHWKIGMWCITSDTEQKTSFSRVIRIRFFHLHINDLFHNQKMLIHSLQDLFCTVHYSLVVSSTYLCFSAFLLLRRRYLWEEWNSKKPISSLRCRVRFYPVDRR